MKTRPRPRKTAAWTASKLLLFAGAVALGAAAWILTRPIVNPGVQDCGTTASFYLTNAENVVIRPGEPGAPPNAPALSQQPTCRELTAFEVRKASIAGAAFLGLTLLGIVVGLLDDKVDYWRAPRFEDLLRPMPRDQRVEFGLEPRVDPEELGRALPPLEPWEAAGVLVFGAAGLVAVRAVAGTEAWQAATPAVAVGGVLGVVALALLPALAAALARWAVFPPGTSIGFLARHVLASSWAGRLRPYAGTFGFDLHDLRRSGVPLGEAVRGVQALQVGGLVAQLLALAVGVPSLLGAVDPDVTFDVPELVAAGVTGFVVLYGLTLQARRWRALPVRPWRGGIDALRRVAADPVRLAALVVGSLAQPLLDAVVLTAALGAAGVGSPGLAVALGVIATARIVGVLSATHQGTGVVEVVTLLGFVAVGVPVGPAAVAVVVARVASFWVPMAAGAIAARGANEPRWSEPPEPAEPARV